MSRRSLFIAAFLMLIPLGVHAQDDAITLMPDNGVYTVGNPITVQVLAHTGSTSITAAEGEISYDPNMVAIDALSIDGSVLTSWATTPSYDNASGVIRFSGWAGTPYQGDQGLLVSITLRQLKSGVAHLDITSGDMLDSKGTNIVTLLSGATYTALPQQVTPEASPAPTSTTSGTPPALSVPSLVTFPDTLSSLEPLIVKGQADPNARVTLWLSRDNLGPDTMTVLAAGDGSFTYTSDAPLSPGSYTLWAQASLLGETSNETPHYHFLVTPPQAAAAVLAGSDYVALALPFIALLGALGLGIAYALHRRGRA